MYRVLLVDDDMIVHMFLKDAFDWGKYGFEVVGDARDGEEALALVHKLNPDLVLTDISMPRINGVSLIQQLRSEQHYDGALIALSCYDDPALIQSAMQHGADEYLMKNHLSEHTMDEVMQKIRDRVAARHPQPSGQQSAEPHTQQDYGQARRELLEHILSSDLSKTELPEKMHKAGLYGKYLRSAVMLMQPDGADAGQVSALLELSSRRILDERCAFFQSTSGFFAILIDFTNVPSTLEALMTLHQWEDLITVISSQYLNLPVGFYISALCEGNGAVIDAFRQAHAMLPYGFYEIGRWQYGSQPPLRESCPTEAEQFVYNLSVLLRDAPGQIHASYQKALQSFRINKVQPGIVLTWLRRCDRAAGLTRSEAEYSRLKRISQLDDLSAEYVSHQRVEVPASVGPAVRSVVQYLHDHYTEPVGLGHAARHGGLSSAYLSSLFKQEMGISFSKYLLQLRMNQVTQRLITTTQTIKMIASDAGFSDYQYFCKAFKRYTGVSPTEYREKGCR